MVRRTVAVHGLLGVLLLSAVGCLGFHRSHPLPRRPTDRPLTRLPSATRKGALAQNAPAPDSVAAPSSVVSGPTATAASRTLPDPDDSDTGKASPRPTSPPSTPTLLAGKVDKAKTPPLTTATASAARLDDNEPPPLPASHVRPPLDPMDELSLPPPPIPNAIKPPPASEPPTVPGTAPLRALHRKASDHYNIMESYTARLRRREQINGKDKPEELMLFKFRKKPWSVYFKWLGTQGHNREVTYVAGRHGSMLHTLLAEGDMPLMPAGKRMSLPPDSIFVRSASRHAITEAGIGVMISRFGQHLDALEKGDKKGGTLSYVGQQTRAEFDKPLDVVKQDIPPGAESQLPRGGSRLWFFETSTHLPQMLITHDHANHEVEYYCYDRLQFPVQLDDDDFDPDKLWKK